MVTIRQQRAPLAVQPAWRQRGIQLRTRQVARTPYFDHSSIQLCLQSTQSAVQAELVRFASMGNINIKPNRRAHFKYSAH